MTRMFFIAALLASSAIGVVAANAQSTSDTKCGPVAYDQAKQTYVGIPCNGGQATSGQTTDTAHAPQKCGPVAYDQASQTYVGIPCAAATTDENPAGRSQ